MPVDHTFFEFGSIRYHVEVIPFPSTFDEETHGTMEATRKPSCICKNVAGFSVGSRERVPVDIDAISFPRGFTLLQRLARSHSAGDEEGVPQVRGGRRAAPRRVRPDAETELLRPRPTQRYEQLNTPLPSSNCFGSPIHCIACSWSFCTDRVKAINQVSLLQSVVLSSQLRDMLGSLGPSGTMKLVYSQREPFFVSKTVRITPSLQRRNKN